ncbi:AI-2E family transporter [Bacteriovorax sp. DB6_IX]|uniref:AI-2E family transporter n=1 Tax=Bacteriovorax sp. DB6_IX TaxID=1353530 RepID=UPI00038A5070|nr:AI-2E family transporter [Bacteriovorax sp. DB6_IX]EQC52084.1 PF01594 domain protein [Bacteriovorax sp. DB6_IX]
MKLQSKGGREKLRIVIFLSTIILFLSGMFFFPRIAIPLVVSYILTLILSPIMNTFLKLGLSRTVSSFFILIGILFFSIYPIVKVVPILTTEANNIQYYAPKVESYVKKEYYVLKNKLRDRTGFELQDRYITDGLTYVRSAISSLVLNVPNLLASVIEWVFVIPLFVFFLLKDAPSFRRFILGITPNSFFEKFYFLSHKFNKQLGDYILAKFIEATIIGVILTSGLLIMDVRFALIFGLVAALTNVIPYLGPILGTVPALIFALAEYGLGTTFGGVVILYLIANAIDIAIVFPILVSKIVDLHPVLVVASVILGSQMMGIMGMIISIPVAAAIKLIFTEIIEDIYNSTST